MLRNHPCSVGRTSGCRFDNKSRLLYQFERTEEIAIQLNYTKLPPVALTPFQTNSLRFSNCSAIFMDLLGSLTYMLTEVTRI